MIRYVLILSLVVASSLYSQSAFLKRGTTGVGFAGLYGSQSGAYSLGGAVSMAFNGRIDAGYSFSNTTFDNLNIGSSSSFSASFIVARGDDKPNRLYFGLNYAYLTASVQYAGSTSGPNLYAHAIGATIGNLAPADRRTVVVWSLDVTRTLPFSSTYGTPKGTFIVDYSIGLTLPLDNQIMVVPAASIARDNKTTMFAFGLQFIVLLPESAD